MADKHLTDKGVETIVELIVAWPLGKRFGWEEIRKEIKARLKAELQLEKGPDVCSRQQLCKYVSIKEAYKTKQRKIRVGRQTVKAINTGDRRNMTPKELALTEKVEARDAKILHLTNENDLFHELFERWAYNAYTKGLSEEMLNQPLPKKSPENSQKKSQKKPTEKSVERSPKER